MRKTFFTKYLVRLMLPLLVPLFLLGSFAILISQNYIKKEINNSNERMMEQAKNSVESIFQVSDPIYYTLNLNSRLISSLKLIVRSSNLQPVDTENFVTFMNLLNPAANIKPVVHSIYIYLNNDGGKFLASNEGLTSLETYYDTSWYNFLARIPDDTNVFVESRTVRRFENQDTPLVTVFRKFSSPGSSKPEGYIIMNLKTEGLANMLNGLLYYPHQSLFLLQQNGHKVARSDPDAESDAWITVKERPDLAERFEVAAADSSYKVSYQRSENYGITYVSATPKSYFYQLPIRLVYLTVVLLTISIVLALLLVYYLSKRNYNSLLTIVRTIENGEKGMPVPELPGRVTDEYSYILQRTVKRFMEQRYLQVQLSEKKYKLKTMEMMALQSNINPHFLANTLRTIFWKSMDLTGGHNEVSGMIDHLSEVVQYSISDADKTVSLKEEIYHTNHYIHILNARYRGKFHFSWAYEESLMAFRVMKLLFQPMIENAIYHGIKESNRFGYIKVRLQQKGDMLQIAIIDTGIGMRKERLQQVRNGLLREDSGRHIGIYNTHKRLQLNHGDLFSFAIFSKYGWGTVIRIEIPIQ
ncbi:histidine kinase [Paenibacillus oryzisoli]|uniref:cache domain-containing sensor histidine kinase n=1 Tax=Paenibacillus oryzisoli TaxID=1850517 RepID=UPI003D29852D